MRHWVKLTLFLQQAAAPLDNNVVERAFEETIPCTGRMRSSIRR